MDDSEIPFRAIDVLSSDDERHQDTPESWEHVCIHESGFSEFDLPDLESCNDLETRDDEEVQQEGADLSEIREVTHQLSEPALSSNTRDGIDASVSSQTVDAIEWNQMIASCFGQYRARRSDLAFPWENGVMAEIFGGGHILSLPQCVGVGEQMMQSSTDTSRDVVAASIHETLPHDAKYLVAVQSLKDVPYFENKAHKLELACGLWMDILSIDWGSSEVGTHLSAALLTDSSGGEAVNILRSCFGVKSPSTLLKRANSFRQFIQWHFKSGFGTENSSQPLPLVEKAVWEYFQYLKMIRVENKRGYTVPSSFLEAVRFGRFTLGLKNTEAILESRRLLGFAAIERRDKGPSRQAPGLEIEHVKRLHSVLREAGNDIDRLGAGCFLICIYSRARWSDVRYVDHVEIEEGRFGALTLFTVEHKTASVGLDQDLLGSLSTMRPRLGQTTFGTSSTSTKGDWPILCKASFDK